MANISPDSLVVWLGRIVVPPSRHPTACLRTTSDASPAEHRALTLCTAEIMIAFDDRYKVNHHFYKTVRFSAFVLFSKVFCTTRPPALGYMFIFQLHAAYLANGDSSACRERAQLSGGPLSISSRGHVFYLCPWTVFIIACKRAFGSRIYHISL